LSANIYVDGFNLYYGALKNTPFKWLDICRLCMILRPAIQINKIRYFTARVKSVPHDPGKPIRQDIYFRALRTIPSLTIHEGHFVGWPILAPQYPFAYIDTNKPPGKPPQNVQIYKTSEKGSDVNLATYLLHDCFSNDFDEAMVISNDADLAFPISLVTGKYAKLVCVVNPHPKDKLSGDLLKAATICLRTINRGVLARCQFPPILTDGKGPFRKPNTW